MVKEIHDISQYFPNYKVGQPPCWQHLFAILSSIKGNVIEEFVRQARSNRSIKVDEEKKNFIEVEPLLLQKIEEVYHQKCKYKMLINKITVRTPYLKDGHLDLTDGHLDLTDGHLHLKDGHLHLTDGHPTWRMDTILEGWTPYLTDGHHTWRMDTILDGWTPYLTDGHHTWRMDTILDGWTPYLTNEYFIFMNCLYV